MREKETLVVTNIDFLYTEEFHTVILYSFNGKNCQKNLNFLISTYKVLAPCDFYVNRNMRKPTMWILIFFFFFFFYCCLTSRVNNFLSHVETEPPIPGYYQYLWGVNVSLLKETTHRPG